MIDLFSFLVALLLVNVTLVIITWNIYGPRIQTLIAKKGEKDQILGKSYLLGAFHLIKTISRTIENGSF